MTGGAGGLEVGFGSSATLTGVGTGMEVGGRTVTVGDGIETGACVGVFRMPTTCVFVGRDTAVYVGNTLTAVVEGAIPLVGRAVVKGSGLGTSVVRVARGCVPLELLANCPPPVFLPDTSIAPPIPIPRTSSAINAVIMCVVRKCMKRKRIAYSVITRNTKAQRLYWDYAIRNTQ